jgi:hypothetical protein
MPRYRLAERMYLKLDDEAEAFLHEAGKEVSYSGPPHRHMIPLDDEARAAIAEIKPLNANAKNIAPRRGDPPWSEGS